MMGRLKITLTLGMSEKWYIHSANSTELPASIASALCGKYALEALDDILVSNLRLNLKGKSC
jgi:hypothetical protein